LHRRSLPFDIFTHRFYRCHYQWNFSRINFHFITFDVPNDVELFLCKWHRYYVGFPLFRVKSNEITRLILNKIFRLKKKSFLRDISCIWRFSWFPLFARFVIIFRLRDEKNSTRLPFNGNGIKHLTIAIIAFNVFSHSASLRVLHKKIPLQLKNDSHYVNESADDIDYFGKCITGVSHVCPAPQAYLSLQGRVASFELLASSRSCCL